MCSSEFSTVCDKYLVSVFLSCVVPILVFISVYLVFFWLLAWNHLLMMFVVLSNSGPISLNIILKLITLIIESVTRDLS
jgi:hypothetical protein